MWAPVRCPPVTRATEVGLYARDRPPLPGRPFRERGRDSSPVPFAEGGKSFVFMEVTTSGGTTSVLTHGEPQTALSGLAASQASSSLRTALSKVMTP